MFASLLPAQHTNPTGRRVTGALSKQHRQPGDPLAAVTPAPLHMLFSVFRSVGQNREIAVNVLRSEGCQSVRSERIFLCACLFG